MRDVLRLVVVFGVTGWLLVAAYAYMTDTSGATAVNDEFAGIIWFTRAALVAWVLLVVGGWTIWRGPWVWPYTLALVIATIPYGSNQGTGLLMIGMVCLYGVVRVYLRRRRQKVQDERSDEWGRADPRMGTTIR